MTDQILNHRYTSNPLAQVAFDITRVSSGFVKATEDNFAQMQRLAERAEMELAEKNPQARTLATPNKNAPQLTPPNARVAARQVEGDLSLLAVLGELQAILQDVSLGSLEARLEEFKKRAKEREAIMNCAAAEFDGAAKESENANSQLQEATADLISAKQGLGGKNELLNSAKNEVQQQQQLLAAQEREQLAQAALNQLAPDASVQEKQQAEQALFLAKQVAQNVSSVLTEAGKIESERQKEVENAQTIVTNLTAKASVAAQLALDALKKLEAFIPPILAIQQLGNVARALTAAAQLTQLLAELQDIIGDANESELKNKMALFKEQQQVVQKNLEKKAEDLAAEQKKAEELNRIMGCVGKILGALLTIVAVVGAAFTGGASLALAAVGVALFALDEILTATTGKSLTERIMQPLMEGVIKPLLKALTGLISDALQSMGMDKKVADIMAAVFAAVLLVVAVIAVAVVGKSAAAKFAETFGKAMMNTISKAVPQMLKSAATAMKSTLNSVSKSLGQVTTKLTTRVGENAALHASRLQMAQTVGGVVQQGLQAGGQIGVGVHQQNAMDSLADLVKGMANQAQLKRNISDLMRDFISQIGVIEQLQKQMTEEGEKVKNTAQQLSRGLAMRG